VLRGKWDLLLVLMRLFTAVLVDDWIMSSFLDARLFLDRERPLLLMRSREVFSGPFPDPRGRVTDQDALPDDTFFPAPFRKE